MSKEGGGFWLKQGKEALLAISKMAAEGLSFERMIEKPERILKQVVPSKAHLVVSLAFVFLFFHFYLLYVLVYAATKATFHWATDTSKKPPKFEEIKRKIGMAVASLFVVQSLSSLLPSAYFPQGMPSFNPRSLFEWFVQLRPQININPQLKVVTSSSHTSCNSSVAATMSRESDELNDPNEEWDGESESGTTTTSLFVEEVGAQIELAVDILPVDKQLRQLKKSAQKAKNYTEAGLKVMQAIASDSREKWSNNDFESAAEDANSSILNDKSDSEA